MNCMYIYVFTVNTVVVICCICLLTDKLYFYDSIKSCSHSKLANVAFIPFLLQIMQDLLLKFAVF